MLWPLYFWRVTTSFAQRILQKSLIGVGCARLRSCSAGTPTVCCVCGSWQQTELHASSPCTAHSAWQRFSHAVSSQHLALGSFVQSLQVLPVMSVVRTAPQCCCPALVITATTGEPDLATRQAFRTDNFQGLTTPPGSQHQTWHAGVALSHVTAPPHVSVCT